jgi:hypothetical protein
MPLREAPAADATGARLDPRRKQVLLYEPSGPIGGTFICACCGAAALQPDLIAHRPDCRYDPARVG